VRIGIAASDFHAILASGLETITRQADPQATIEAIAKAVAEVEPVIIYVGLPISLSGTETASTADAISIASSLARAIDVPVRMIDERLTTVTAAGALRSSNRSSKDGRKIIDQIAATVILEQAMSLEKAKNEWAGVSVGEL
jgi:putative Holliday junction resolvase